MQTLFKTDAKDTAALTAVINDYVARRTADAAAMSPYYQDLWEQIGKLLTLGGKRLRPRMCILSYEAFGGEDTNSILPAAVALELLHLAMLVHDDIIDRDYVRYGVDNISGSYQKFIYDELVEDEKERLHYANSAAILGGDLLLSEAYMLIANSNIAAENIVAVQKLMQQAIFEVIAGELLDTESSFRGRGSIASEEIALYKTASYSFTLPMLAGAYLSGLPKHLIPHVHEFGKNIGIAFQLQDDIIGVFGDEKATGKSATGDLREGKSTYMIEQFFMLASNDEKAAFTQHFGKQTLSDDEAELLRELLRSSGAYDKVLSRVAFYESKARAALAQLPVREASMEGLEALIAIATKRTA